MPSDHFLRALQASVTAFCIITAGAAAFMVFDILEDAAPRIASELAAR